MNLLVYQLQRSKTYSYVKDNNKNEKTAKGIRKYVIKTSITGLQRHS